MQVYSACMGNSSTLPDPGATLPQQKQAFGPLIGIGIVIIVLVIGAFYFLCEEISRRNQVEQLPLITSGESVVSENVR